MLDALQNSLLSIIYPQECRVCLREVAERACGDACDECWSATRIFGGDEMLCEKCGAFLGERSAPVAARCRRCDEHDYDKAVAAGVYERALAAAIGSLKDKPVIPQRLRSVLRNAIESFDLSDADVIVPVPLSKQRHLERGFNQAEIIARAVSHTAPIPVDTFSLARKLNTPVHRVGMDQRARELTVQSAFEVVRPKLVKGRKVLLVDDVLTSGATASACAQVLKKNGAERVNVFTLARAVMH